MPRRCAGCLNRSPHTDEAVRLAQDARAAGAAAGLVAPVSYTPPSEDEVFAHVAALARESRLPLCLYDNPATTQFAFSPALDGRLTPLWALFTAHSSLPVLYAAADLLGLCRTEPPRPILPLRDGARRQVADVLAESDLA